MPDRSTPSRAQSFAPARVSGPDLALEQVLDVVSDVFVLLDADFRLVYHNEANRAAMRAAGGNPEEAVGRVVWEVLPMPPGTDAERECRRAMVERVVTQWEECYHPDVCLRGRAYPTADGGLLVVATNVTESWKAARAEREARAAAEEANQAKVGFLRAMSHELRTPLNAIGGYADLLALGVRGRLTDEQLQDVERIRRNQRHLLGIVDDIVSFARVDAGHITYAMADVPVRAIVESTEPLIAPQLQAKRITFVVEPCAPEVVVRADAEKAGQVLLNLLANAVKFTPGGGRVTIDCESRGSRVAVRVRDTGVGIPAERLGEIFEPFVQVHRSLVAPTSGTGLGLAISRELARGMGGDLSVESAPGVGSEFTLTLQRA